MCKVTPSGVDKKSVDTEKAVRLCNYGDVITTTRNYCMVHGGYCYFAGHKFELKRVMSLLPKTLKTERHCCSIICN